MTLKMLYRVLVLLGLIFLIGCESVFQGGLFGGSSFGELFGNGGSEIEVSPDQLAQEGMEELKAHRYESAIEKFQKIRDQYPYNKYAILAELKIADAYYEKEDYIEAQEAYRHFEQLHPKNEAVPYVVYQQGMCLFRQMSGYDRDQTPVVEAIQTFSRLQQTFPDSEYTARAQARITECQNSLAHHEYYVGEFYFNQRSYKAARGRFLSLVKNYPDTGFHVRALEYIRVCDQMITEGIKPRSDYPEAPASGDESDLDPTKPPSSLVLPDENLKKKPESTSSDSTSSDDQDASTQETTDNNNPDTAPTE